MRRIYKSALAAVPLALVVATATMGSGGEGKGDGPRGRHGIERLKSKLGLTDDQVKSIEAAKTANRDSQKQLHTQFELAMAAARRAALNGEDASAKNDAAAKLFGQILDLRAKELRQIGAVLTPDQRATFASFKGRGGRGHWGHRGKRHDDAPPSE